MERQDWEMSVEEFNDCGCAMNGDQNERRKRVLKERELKSPSFPIQGQAFFFTFFQIGDRRFPSLFSKLGTGLWVSLYSLQKWGFAFQLFGGQDQDDFYGVTFLT